MSNERQQKIHDFAKRIVKAQEFGSHQSMAAAEEVEKEAKSFYIDANEVGNYAMANRAQLEKEIEHEKQSK